MTIQDHSSCQEADLDQEPGHVVVKTITSQSSVYMRERMDLQGLSGGVEGGLS